MLRVKNIFILHKFSDIKEKSDFLTFDLFLYNKKIFSYKSFKELNFSKKEKNLEKNIIFLLIL